MERRKQTFEDHIYEEIIYSDTPPTMPTVTSPTVSRPTPIPRVTPSRSVFDLRDAGGGSSLSSFTRSISNLLPRSLSTLKINISCNCCQMALSMEDTTGAVFPTYLKCHDCRQMVCKPCRDDNYRCHECAVRLATVIYEPEDLMGMQTKTLLGFIRCLHYPDETFVEAHKAFLVKQLLVRFQRHPEWDPNRYIAREKKELATRCQHQTPSRHHRPKPPGQIVRPQFQEHASVRMTSRPICPPVANSSQFRLNTRSQSQLSVAEITHGKHSRHPRRPSDLKWTGGGIGGLERTKSVDLINLNVELSNTPPKMSDKNRPEMRSLNSKIAHLDAFYATRDIDPRSPPPSSSHQQRFLHSSNKMTHQRTQKSVLV